MRAAAPSWRATSITFPTSEELKESFARFPALAAPDPYTPAPDFAPKTLVEERDTNQSHLRMIYRPDIAVADVRERAALSIYSTLLGGSMGSRLFEEIREKRGLCYSVYAIDHVFADVPILQLGSGLESSKCVEAYTRMREIVEELREQGPTEEEVQRARAYAAGRTVLAFENTNAVARHAANQKHRVRRGHRPRRRDCGARRGHLRGGPGGGRERRREARGGLRGATCRR